MNNLIIIACHYGFDGYLINIENRLSAKMVEAMLYFVGELTSRLKEKVSHAEVLWYDAVTIEGDLWWQNRLNKLNKPFFDKCDGIFTNYCWRESFVQESIVADVDSSTVFMGVDVFGRNTFGGGQFNCDKAVLASYLAHQTSVALFAPGWTFENFPPTQCLAVEQTFWNSFEKCINICLWFFFSELISFLFFHIFSDLHLKRFQLPIHCWFSRGFGKYLFINGKVKINYIN